MPVCEAFHEVEKEESACTRVCVHVHVCARMCMHVCAGVQERALEHVHMRAYVGVCMV